MLLADTDMNSGPECRLGPLVGASCSSWMQASRRGNRLMQRLQAVQSGCGVGCCQWLLVLCLARDSLDSSNIGTTEVQYVI